MVDFLLESDRDMTVLTCRECALDIYEELIEEGRMFIQDRSRIIREIENSDAVVEITKLKTEDREEDIYYILDLEDEKYLNNRTVVVNSCVSHYIDIDRIPSSSKVVTTEDEEDEVCDCDECIVIREIMADKNVTTFEQAIRAAYRCGRDAALVDIIEEAKEMLF
jgi:hypothetical protein